jgi:alanyl-tRNA synthetase
MTHVLNYALKKVLLGDQDPSVAYSVTTIDQKGSLVDTEKLRFDFTWNGALSAVQVARIEAIVIEHITNKVQVYAEVVPLAAATQISSLRAVFGERYPDPVRVISVGAEVQALLADPTNPKWNEMSVEFCGGTHLTNASQAEDFVLVEESGIAKGIRRIVGLTRDGAKGARARAAVLLERLSALEAMEGGADLLNKSKAIKIEVRNIVTIITNRQIM